MCESSFFLQKNIYGKSDNLILWPSLSNHSGLKSEKVQFSVAAQFAILLSNGLSSRRGYKNHVMICSQKNIILVEGKILEIKKTSPINHEGQQMCLLQQKICIWGEKEKKGK